MFKLSSFHKNGIAYPLALKKKYSGVFLEKKYLEFKNKSVLKIGRPVVLKPHLLSNFFYKIATDKYNKNIIWQETDNFKYIYFFIIEELY